MHLERTSEVDATEYERFLDGFARRPGTALAYHYPMYMRFLSDVAYPGSARRFIVARDARGAIRGVLPGLHVRTPDVNVWLSLAYFGPNAGALVADAESADAAEVTRELLSAAVADARSFDCGSMTIYSPVDAAADTYRAGLEGCDFDVERVTQWLPLPEDREQSPWPRKVRYDIRRAEAQGVTVRPVANEEECDRVWDIYLANCEEAGIPLKPRDHIRWLYREMGPHAVFLVAEQHGTFVAGLLCLVGGGVISYYLPCTSPGARSSQPGLLLLDRAVAIGRSAGARALNFEASPGIDSGVYAFKARCGGRPVPYKVFVKLLKPRALDTYRALTADGLARAVPHAFIVPFAAIA